MMHLDSFSFQLKWDRSSAKDLKTPEQCSSKKSTNSQQMQSLPESISKVSQSHVIHICLVRWTSLTVTVMMACVRTSPP